MKIRPQTRSAIVEAAFQLYKSDPNASVADIAMLAGVGRATLHRYFPSREDLTVELALTAVKEIDEAAEIASEKAASYTEAIKLILFALIPLADRYWFLSNQTTGDDPAVQSEYKRQAQETADLIEQAKNEGGLNPQLPTSWLCEVFDGLLFAAWEMVRKENATAKQASELAWNTFINGAGTQHEQ
ncbi:MAG: TetR/AcrR family transcriptional regulator [Halioglobus sp.]